MSTTPDTALTQSTLVEEARSHLNALTTTLEKEIGEVRSARAKLEKDISEFDARKAQIAAVHNIPSVVTLNIGGTTFATSKDNLLREKGSLLETLMTSPTAKPSADGSYFIDRDPAQFRHILNYLRGSAPFVPAAGREFDELSADVEFYDLPGYKKALTQQTGSTTASTSCETSPTADAALASTALPSSAISVPTTAESSTETAAISTTDKELPKDAPVATSASTIPVVVVPAYSGNAKEFIFTNLTACDGIINWIGTEGGSKEFVNPITSGKIQVECPEGVKWFGNTEYLTEKGKPTSHWKPATLPTGGGVCNSNKPSINNLWISLKLPFAVQLTAWSAMRINGCSMTMKNWELAGSNDGKTWTVIFAKENDTTHDQPDGLFKLEKKVDDKKKDDKKIEEKKEEVPAAPATFYTHLRWKNTSNFNQQRYQCVHFYAMELYGRAQV